GRRARGDEKRVRGEPPQSGAVRAEDRHRGRVLEARVPGDELDPVPLEVAFDLARLAVRHVLEAADELAQALLPVEPEAHPVELAAPEPRQVKRRFPESLRGES